jgi:hypothetical protein
MNKTTKLKQMILKTKTQKHKKKKKKKKPWKDGDKTFIQWAYIWNIYISQ